MPDYPHGTRSAMALKTVCRRIRCSSKEICLSSDEGKILEYYLGMGYMNGIIDGAMRQTMPDILEISTPEARAASEKHLDSDFCFESSHYSLTL